MDNLDNNKLFQIRNESEDGNLEVSVSTKAVPVDNNNAIVEQRLTDIKMELDSIDDKIVLLENNADMFDYAISAGVGAIAGVLDILFVGEIKVSGFNDPITKERSNKLVTNLANKEGYSGSDYNGALGFLNNKYGNDGNIYHPSLFGLVLSISNALGKANLFNAIFNGVISWGIGASMMAPIKLSGLPSSITSLLGTNTLKVKPNKLAKLNSVVDKGISGKNSQGLAFNLTNELSFLGTIGKQALVVGINEVLVRAFYFLRRLFQQIKEYDIKSISDLKYVDWELTIPFKNRTIVRMLAISETVMLAIDLADATIQGLVKSAGNAGAFFGHFFLRINYVNIARCAISYTNDILMGVSLDKRRNERIQLMSEYVSLTNSKLFYKQSDMWKKAEDVSIVLDEACKAANEAKDVFIKSIDDTKSDINDISSNINKANNNNPGLKKSITDILD